MLFVLAKRVLSSLISLICIISERSVDIAAIDIHQRLFLSRMKMTMIIIILVMIVIERASLIVGGTFPIELSTEGLHLLAALSGTEKSYGQTILIPPISIDNTISTTIAAPIGHDLFIYHNTFFFTPQYVY